MAKVIIPEYQTRDSHKEQIKKLTESLNLLGQATSAEDHYAYEWAEEARKQARNDIKSVLEEFLAEGESVFATFFPNLYEKLQSQQMDLDKVDLINESDIDYLVEHKKPPPSWEAIPPNEQLLTAIKKKKLLLVNKALENGADINLKQNGTTPLIEALLWANREVDIIELLIKKGAALSIKTDDGKTILIIAASQGNSTIAKLALDKGVDPNLTSPYGGTALMKAAYYGHNQIVKLLLESGADPNLTGEDSCGRLSFALHQAAETGEVEAVKILLESGANPKLKDGQDRTPLETAKHWQRTEVIAVLQDLS